MSNYPKEIDNFVEKLNKLDNNTYVIEEEIIISNGVYEAELQHDNVNKKTINVYTGTKLSGNKLETYIISTPSLTPWKTNIKIFSSISPLYISYETQGDTVEAEDINKVQDSIISTQMALNTEASRAKTSEQALTDNLTNEVNRANLAENTLKDNIATETNRAKSVESSLTTNLNAEITRATNAENTLTNNINSESTRAKAAENTLTNAINSNTPIWNDKYTKNEIDNKLSALVTSLDWKESVDTFSVIATTYPSPEDGWTINVKDTDITYRYDGTAWIPISANSIPLASSSVDGKMSKQDKIDHDDMNTKKHAHDNKAIIDTITKSLIDTWNSAYTHISDSSNPHATTASQIGLGDLTNDVQVKRSEMGAANGVATLDSSGVNNQDPKAHTHDDRYYTESEADTKFATKTQISQLGFGDMVKSVYDTNDDGIIDNADKLDGKHGSFYAPVDSPIFTGIPVAPTASLGDSSTQIATTAFLNNTLAAYGVGSVAKDISNTDLNSCQTSGFYRGNTVINAPNTGWFYFIVISHSDTNWMCQYAISYGSGNTANLIYIRTKVDGTWGSWQNVYTSNNKLIPSDIGAMKKGPLIWNDLKGV